jgi:GT2 family glycosyltransferase
MPTPASAPLPVAAVVVTRRGAALLEACIPAVLAQVRPFAHVFVVDNASPDALDFLARFPSIQALHSTSNAGFAAGANRGLAAALAHPEVAAVAVVNDDVVLDPGWSEAAFRALARHPRNGACATCVLRAADGRVDSAGIEWRAPGLADNAGHGSPPPHEGVAPHPVAGASAAAVLYRREMLEEVGLFDEWLFAYQEDVDLSLRAAARGWRTVFAPGARSTHAGQASNRPFPLGGTWADCWNARNRLLVALKSLPGAEWRRHWAAIVATQARLLLRSIPERRGGAVAWGVLWAAAGAPRALRARGR